MEITSVSSSSTLSNKIVDPVIDAEVRGEEGILAAVSAASSSPKQTSLISNSNLLPTNKAGNIDKEIVESVSQLESVITKTIENTKNIKEIPVIEEDDVPVVVEIEKELDLSNAIEELNREKAEKTNLKENDQVNPIVANEPVKLTNSTTETSSHSLNEYVAVENNTYETSSDVNVDTSTAGSYKLKEFVNMNASTSPSPEVEVVTLLPVSISLEPGISTANSFAIEVGKLETTSLLPSTLYTLSMNAAITVSTTPTPIQLTNAVTTSLYSSPATVSSSSSSYSSMSVSPSTTSSDSSFVPPFISSTVTTSLATTTSSIQTPMLTKDDNETDVTASVNGSSQTPFITPQVKDVNSSSPTTALNSPTTSAYATTPTTLSSETNVPTVTSTDYVEPKVENTPPMIRTRLQKFAVTSGKAFTYSVPADTFYDTEDLTNLRLDLTDKDGRELKASSWLQFNPETHVLYGLPLDDSVSKWQYRLSATDSGNESVTETLEISVQQHRGVRTVNHEISITVRINEKNMHNIDWQLKLMRDVALTLGDENTSWIVVREIRAMPQDPNTATFVYFNETFPTSECPEGGLNKLVKSLDASRLSDLIYPTLSVKSITGQLIGACQKSHITKPKPTTHMATNVPPLPRNQVDRVNATVGHLLVFKVPSDTFYDPNDNEQLSLTLKTKDHKELNPRHWLQFDSKNQEFYGIPKSGDTGSEEYLLVAQDAGGLSATDALVVVVNHAPKKEFSVYFKAYLAIRHEQFNADLQRKFVERIAQLFGDSSTQYVQIRSVTTHHDSDSTIVNFYNTSLYKSHNRCPEEEIEAVRSVYLIKDHMVRDHVKKILGPELNLTNVQALPLGLCHPQTDIIHRDYAPVKPDQPTLKSSFSDEYMYTIILPAIIIVTMILIALMVACCLHRRRRKSGKMELGDEEERRSFRKKNIPVIFQDELDEKPEIGNKSPIILKDEKPPLLPPSYNTSNMNGDNDVDEYVPPPAVVVGGREARGKSPATPSYRKPPPYVSP
uniref:Dystroglycan 1 n=3 Tax=Ceratitis capitata TaxID=7213 RepID=W8B7Y5_CERCA